MKKVYINGIGSISAQKTFDTISFLNAIQHYDATVIFAIDPDYKNYIPPAAARRMAKAIKMSVVASNLALAEANIENLDAIITGTGMGCLNDSEKFVSGIIDNNEQFLTPTPFIQSTHNTVGGQIALGLGCKSYNFTYVHSAISFESAVLDALLQIQIDEATNILVGGVDEISMHTVNIHRLIGHVKTENVKDFEKFSKKSKGAIFSESATFFVLSSELNSNSYAEIVAVEMFNTLPIVKVSTACLNFLKENNLTVEDIDILISGENGDSNFDHYYDVLTNGLFAEKTQLHYKHLVGENNTISAFAYWLTSKILKNATIPKVLFKNEITPKNYKTVLLYNQYRGESHSFAILKSC